MRWTLAILAVLILGGCGGGDGDGGAGPPPQLTAAELTARGWTRLEAGELESALDDFDLAITRDATYAEAYAGQGWARLGLADTSAKMAGAGASFTAAYGLGITEAKVLAGRAAANLGVGGAMCAQAAADAAAARQADPDFQFAYRPSFDFRDLLLIEAFARVGQDDLAGALAAADQIADSGIEIADSATWVVDSQTYGNFAGAVLAHLHKLSGAHAG